MNKTLKIFGVFFGYIVSVYFLYLFFKGFNANGFIEKAQISSNLIYYIIAMCFFLLSLYFRSLRWEAMVFGSLSPKSKTSKKVYLTYLVSDGLNNILPFRMGDIYRVMNTRSYSDSSNSRLFILLIFERLIDLTILFIFGVVTLFFIMDIEFIKHVFLIAVDWFISNKYDFLKVGLIFVSFVLLVKNFKFLNLRFKNIIDSFKGIKLPIYSVLLLSIITWFMEFIVFVIVFKILLIKIDYVERFVVFVTATLSTLIPSAPGYIGTFHFFSSKALDLFSVGSSTAAFFAIIIHLIIVLPTIIIVVFYLNVSFISVVKKGMNIKYE
jgi:glycosyltransferase 2 family protein